jgi:TolB-like protein
MTIWSGEIIELEKLYDSVKGALPLLTKELEQLIKTDDANVVMLYSRRCLEVIVTDLCECELKRPRKTEPLKGIIDKLNSEEKVPSHIITSMHGLNSLSTYGAHPKDFDPEQVKPVLSNLTIVIRWYLKYRESQAIESVKEALPSSEKTVNLAGKKEIVKSKKKVSRLLVTILLVVLIGATGTIIYFAIKGQDNYDKLEKSIAVLPFRNDSLDDSTQYFMNGVMDELLTRLQFIEELRVISRTSVEQYRGTNKTIPEIANDLKVNFIVEGSGQKIGKLFRIRVQLIRAKNESHLWGNNFEQQILTMTEYFKAQSGFVEDIANQLKAFISPGEKKLIVKIPTEDITAYEAYLKGQFYVKTFNLNELDTALYYFELAKEKDPEFALAYAGISYIWLGYQQIGKITPDEAGPKIMSAIETALALDSTLADVHYTLAMINFLGMWDWKNSELEFKKAIAINPNYADAQALYSLFLSIMGRPEEAIKHIELAIKLDPKNPMIKTTYSQVLFFTRRYNEAISVSRELLDTDSTILVALDPLFNALHMTGRDEEAFEALKYYFTNMYKDFAHVFDQYPKLGYTGTLNLEGDTLLTQSKTKYILPIELAYFYVFSGNKKLALDCLEKAYEIHDPNMIIITSPTYDILRNEPRFQELLRKLNIPNYD